MSRIIQPGNGQGGSVASMPPDPFEQLRAAVMRVPTARDKRESMARVQHCVQLADGLRQAFVATNRQLQILISLLARETNGEIIRVGVKGKPNMKGIRFEDSNGVPLPVADPAQGLLLKRPDHVEPLTVVYLFPDNTEEREELPMLPTQRS